MPARFKSLLVLGDVAVHVFIIVSGFVITHLLLNKQESYPTYLTRRFFRLAPVYIFCLALATITTFTYEFAYINLPYAAQSDMRIERLAETNQHFGLHVLAHLTMLHGAIPANILPFAGTTLLGPAWSLSLEWQFYLIAPFLVPLLAKGRRQYIVTAAACLSLFAASKLYIDDLFQYSSMLLLSIQFFPVGISTRLALSYCKPNWKTFLLFTIVFMLLLTRWRLEALCWALWCVFIFREAGLLRLGPKTGNAIDGMRTTLASNQYITALGRWSYSTYIVHIPIFSIFVYMAIYGLGMPKDQTSIQIVLLASAVTLVPLSYMLYRFIEKPGIQLGAKLANPETSQNRALS